MVDQKFPETDQKFPETGQFFFGRPKKMRKRPNNWSTKRLTKTTWTGLLIVTFINTAWSDFIQAEFNLKINLPTKF